MNSSFYKDQATLMTELASRAKDPEVRHRLRNRAQQYLTLASVAEATARGSEPSQQQQKQQQQSKQQDNDE
jgi:hypothetical protein